MHQSVLWFISYVVNMNKKGGCVVLDLTDNAAAGWVGLGLLGVSVWHVASMVHPSWAAVLSYLPALARALPHHTFDELPKIK